MKTAIMRIGLPFAAPAGGRYGDLARRRSIELDPQNANAPEVLKKLGAK
jgi:hypothetical protein